MIKLFAELTKILDGEGHGFKMRIAGVVADPYAPHVRRHVQESERTPDLGFGHMMTSMSAGK
jgi:hypothetical protein